MTARRLGDDAEFAVDRMVHGVGLVLGVAGAVVAIVHGLRSHDGGVPFVGTALYAAGLVAMLGCSAAYNLTPPSKARALLRRFDHAAIFIMIAATYSPFTLGRMDGAWSSWLAAVVWSVAILGALAKIVVPHRVERIAVAAYLILGWCVLVALKPMLDAFGPATVILIALGGLIYSIGVGFYLWQGLRFHKAIWHGLVLSAAACHYTAVYINI